MHRFVKNALRRLADQGVTLTNEEAFDDLARLEELARAIKNPPRCGQWNDYEVPVSIAGISFYQPTLGVIAWSLQVSEWFEPENPLGDLALLYGMAHAQAPEKYSVLDNAVTAQGNVLKWAKKLKLKADEARSIIDELMPQPKMTRREFDLSIARLEHGDNVVDWPAALPAKVLGELVKDMATREQIGRDDHGQLVMDLVAEYGQTPDYWIYEVSLSRIYEAQEHMENRKLAEANAAAAVKGNKSQVPLDAYRSKTDAQGRFNIAAKAFERKWLSRKKPAAGES